MNTLDEILYRSWSAFPPEHCTVVWYKQEQRRKYWATRSSVRSFARTAHSFACSGLLALLTPSAVLINLLARSLRSWDSEFLMSQNDLVLSHSATVCPFFLRSSSRILTSVLGLVTLVATVVLVTARSRPGRVKPWATRLTQLTIMSPSALNGAEPARKTTTTSIIYSISVTRNPSGTGLVQECDPVIFCLKFGNYLQFTFEMMKD